MPDMTVSIDEELKDGLNSLAEATQRPMSYLVKLALTRFVEQETRYVAEILEGIRQIENGQGIPEEEIDKRFETWEAELEAKQAKVRKRAS